jgi:hypothetical protein
MPKVKANHLTVNYDQLGNREHRPPGPSSRQSCLHGTVAPRQGRARMCRSCPTARRSQWMEGTSSSRMATTARPRLGRRRTWMSRSSGWAAIACASGRIPVRASSRRKNWLQS